MATEFRTPHGLLVAHRYWGGDERGTVVELRPGAALVSADRALLGDDGSVETLRTLAAWCGQGRVKRPWED